MKKIILFLMFMVSVSFADTWLNTSLIPPLQNNVCVFDASTSLYYVPFSSSTTSEVDFGNHSSGTYLQRQSSTSSTGTVWNIHTCRIIGGTNWCFSERSDVFVYSDRSSSPLCANVNLPDPLDCDPTKGTFTNLDGTCTDCSSHLFDTDVSGVASCACGAKGATYTPSSVTGEVPVQGEGNSTSTQSSIKCSDGSSKYVYYNKKIPTDTNSSTPTDNNNTNDNNTSIPIDNNGTQDGNGTIPNDGNGTNVSGKDYTSLLTTMRDYLQQINGHESSIDNSISGTNPLEIQTYGIPVDATGGSWDTYSDTWSRLTDSFNDVLNKSNELKSLFENGFSSPFTKSSISTCRYQSSFEFGNLGVIPVDFDLCHVFSPLRPVIYTFSYLFFVFYILVFCVKMFFRLV